MSSFINHLDATEMAESIKNREISPHEAVMDSINRIEAENSFLNAVVNKRYDAAIAESKNVDRTKPFAGVPLLLKDISHSLKGEPITAGSRLLASTKADVTSHFVSSLKEAGFIIIGHTNAPEFGLKNITESKLHGAARNPKNHRYSPGGSSGGAAASVASGMVPVAAASDGGGSIRIPASFCGLIGLKPTRGRIAVGPGSGRQWQGAAIDFALTKSIRDTAQLLDSLQTYQKEAAFHTPVFEKGYKQLIDQRGSNKYRIAFSTVSPVGTPVSEDAVSAVKDLALWLERNGHHVEEASPDLDGKHLMEQYYLMNSGEMAALRLSLENAIGRPLTHDDMEIESWVLAEAGLKTGAGEFSISLSAWDFAAYKMEDFHRQFDLFLTPATSFSAPEVGELTPGAAKIQELLEVSHLNAKDQQHLIYKMFEPALTYSPFTQLANLTGQPAISLPTGKTEDDLPIGIQFMASKGNEHLLLDISSEIEEYGLFQP
ncbi:amidase [Jeotgalibacillus campisalis]|uniref:Amidase n=1 Tax=Jeotgalibacillus campisalis TaxID=220754 RepID=A0A0C2VTT4_9BACL|nr:amidase [Jeotgalibacillus campisalis]KIL47836.1 amidase [Jeotgalibacillus campisalis]